MKYYQLGSLYELIFQSGPLKLSAKEWKSSLIANLISDVAGALTEIHERGIFHNDLKVSTRVR